MEERKVKLKRMLWTIFITVFIGYIALAGLMFLFQERFVYFPAQEIYETPESYGLSWEEVDFPAQDGVRLWAWFIRSPKPLGAVVLYCHGNAGNISHCMDTILIFSRLGLDTFIFDYRGYGKSEGKPSEEGTYRDVEGAWNYLVEKKKIPPERIIVFGRSLGGAIASWIAEQKRPKLLVLESTFTSVPDLAENIYPFLPVRILTRIQYPTQTYLKSVACPLLIIHSRDDEIVPFHHGLRLFESAPPPKEFFEIRGGHNDGFIRSAHEYSKKWKDFLQKYWTME